MNIFDRLQAMMPDGVQRIHKTGEELLAWNQEQGRLSSVRIAEENRQNKIRAIMGRSGIQPLHEHCTFDNYVVENEKQRNARIQAKAYAEDFGKNFGGFIFSGAPGTGKNHLAAAIGNHLVGSCKSVLVVTVAELMSRTKSTYRQGSKESEEDIINKLCSVDLLVLDDVGVQHGTNNEEVVIFQIVDRRTSNKKPVGMLTNLNHAELTKLLGVRVIDRMTMGGGIWVNFNWESYRKRVK